MKKLSLFLIIVLMSFSSAIEAQRIVSASDAQIKGHHAISLDAIDEYNSYQKVKKYQNYEGAKATLYTNTFSDPTEWTIETEGADGEWQIYNEPEEMTFYGVSQSPSFDDGWAGFDGAETLFDDLVDVDVQNGTITMNEGFSTVGEEIVFLTFYQEITTFNVDEQIVEISTDGGFSWNPIIVNGQYTANNPFPPFRGEITIDISLQAANEPDVRLRFRWRSDYPAASPDATQQDENNFGGGYGWIIDDINVSGPIFNNLGVVTAFFNDNFETWYESPDTPNNWVAGSDEVTDLDIVNSLQYHTKPNYATTPFNFATVVDNLGVDEQTGVILTVTIESPSGELQEFPSLPISIPAGERDTIRIYDAVPDSWIDPEVGTYFIDYRIDQDQVDEFPGNNVGPTLATRISSDANDDGSAWIQVINSSTISFVDGFYQNRIIGARFTFGPEDIGQRVITGIDFALNDETNTTDENLIQFNMRKQGVLFLGPENYQINAIFPYDQDGLIYTVNDETALTTSSVPVWNTINFEDYGQSPVLIDEGIIHQGEIFLFPYGSDAVQPSFGSTTNSGSSLTYDIADGETAEWGIFGDIDLIMRLRTQLITSVDDVTKESGIILVQNFPNPVVDNTTIQFQLEESGEATFEVFDLTGKLVHSQDFGNVPAYSTQMITFNKRNLASGTYTYSIVTGDERVTRKMIIE